MTQLTLSEAHKVAETLQRDIDALQAEITESSRPIKANVLDDQLKAGNVRFEIQESFKKLDVMLAASQALGEAISQNNERVGINTLLKRRNLALKHRQWLDFTIQRVKQNNENAIDAKQAESFFSRMSAANSVNAVQIRVVSDDAFADLKRRNDEAVRQLDEINRKISSLNHKTMIDFNG